MSYIVKDKSSSAVEDCEPPKLYYLGQTQNSISRRITEFLQNGALKDHMRKIHRKNLTRSEIVKIASYIKKSDTVKNKKYLKH